ncbi:MAG: helix-turn-helix domain-containing protein [Alphaproteobacteria bacterium]|nr:helix-turn-helix domain-containing protein [Alphaproteobacteria bacterium]
MRESYARNNDRRGVAHHVAPVDVKAARKKLGLSQSRFAATFGCPLKTVQKWEQGERQPTGAARVLLRAIGITLAVASSPLMRRSMCSDTRSAAAISTASIKWI